MTEGVFVYLAGTVETAEFIHEEELRKGKITSFDDMSVVVKLPDGRSLMVTAERDMLVFEFITTEEK